MKILVCGGREFRNRELLNKILDSTLKFSTPITMLINGGARGADSLAHLWALTNGVQTVKCEANWNYHKKSAGAKRNLAMLLLDPDLVIAFPGGTGTAHMIKVARDYGIPVQEIKE